MRPKFQFFSAARSSWRPRDGGVLIDGLTAVFTLIWCQVCRLKGMDRTITPVLHDLIRHSSSPARSRRNRQRMIRFQLAGRVKTVLDQRAHKAQVVPPEFSAEPAKDSDQSGSEQFAVFLQQCIDKTELPFGSFSRNFNSDPCKADKASFAGKDIFPLPLLDVVPEWLVLDGAVADRTAVLKCLNSCMMALNFLNLGMPKAPGPAKSRTCYSQSQRTVVQHIASRVIRFLSRLDRAWASSFSWQGALQSFAPKTSNYEKVRGQDVDLPAVAGTCNPSQLVPQQLWEQVSDPARVFPQNCEPASCWSHAAAPEVERRAYVHLTARELRCGKLRLRLAVKGVANIFAAPKATKGRQRKIWDGSVLSQMASPPPKPHRLANPSSFLDICVPKQAELYMSKRDASTYFDSLVVPKQLQPWFGQQPVQVKELVKVGLSLRQIASWVDDLDTELQPHTLVFPVNVVWPMGFSWSPCIAQANTIGCLQKCRVPESQILSLDHDLPRSQQELCAVATDDVLLFHRCKQQGAKTLQRLDRVFAEHGIVRNKAKDVNLAGRMTGLGCDINSSPPLVEPALHKIANVVLGICDLLVSKRASPANVNSLLGVLQWFCLLQRSMFSIFDAVYDFVRRPDSSQEQAVPMQVQSEFLVALALLPLLPAALDRGFLPELLACDAAPDFGFGVCSLDCGRKITQQVGRLAERRGDFVRLFPGEGDEPEVARLGNPHRLPFRKGDFKTVISSRARFSAHSGLLECHGVLLALKWVSRSHSKHSSKPVILVDAKAAIGCVSKGRSSARALHRVLRSTAALCLACDFLPRLVYIPSESNPADAPSRGCSGHVRKGNWRKRR